MTVYFDPFQGLDRLLTAFRGSGSTDTAWMPVDLYREGDHYVLNADLPGVDPASVDISVDGHTLSIRAGRLLDALEGAEWLAKERPSVTFVRQFTLSDDIDRDGITATCTNGVLSVVVPIAEHAKPRKVSITVGEQQQQLAEGRRLQTEAVQA
jgi:HSP20 family protein